MGKNARILLQINSSNFLARLLLKGIIKYAKNHTNWLFYHETPFYLGKTNLQARIKKIQQWKPDGIIIRQAHSIDRLLDLEIPTIVCPNVIIQSKFKNELNKYPGIVTDCQRIGEMGASYFLQKGYRNYAFAGYKNAPWSSLREHFFCKTITESGYNTFTSSTSANWSKDHQIENLSRWLKELPKPIAIMACNDDRGLDVIEACQLIGLHIPEEVAVLGVDNDEIVCEMANPTLSSIVVAAEKAGYEAAKLLHRLIRSKAAIDQQKIMVLPQDICDRQSTDIMVVNDSAVAQALNFIRTNTHQNLQVVDVVNHVCLSRRNLELRFRKAIGKSVHFEIRRIRAEAISQMLLETNLPIYQIAAEFGFNDPMNISRFFKKEMGISLHDYRKKYKI